jgi:hypothetical protein
VGSPCRLLPSVAEAVVSRDSRSAIIRRRRVLSRGSNCHGTGAVGGCDRNGFVAGSPLPANLHSWPGARFPVCEMGCADRHDGNGLAMVLSWLFSLTVWPLASIDGPGFRFVANSPLRFGLNSCISDNRGPDTYTTANRSSSGCATGSAQQYHASVK